MIRTTLSDIVPLIEIGEAWVRGLDPSVPQFVDQKKGKAFWAKDIRATPFYKVIQQRTTDMPIEVTDPTCVIAWPTGEHALYLPESYRSSAPYENRQYVTGKVDCYSLAREWYWKEREVILPPYVATREHMVSGHFDAFDTHAEREKWETVIRGQPGDAVLFRFHGNNTANHCGILLEDMQLLHHFHDRLSTIEPMAGVWRENLWCYLRYRGD